MSLIGQFKARSKKGGAESEHQKFINLCTKYKIIIECPACGGHGTLFRWTDIDDGYDVQCLDCDNTGYVHNRDQDVLVPLKDLVQLFIKTPLQDMLAENLIKKDEDGEGYYITADGTALLLGACELDTQGGEHPDGRFAEE